MGGGTIATLMIEEYLTGKIKDQNIYDKIINANLLNKKWDQQEKYLVKSME